MLSSSDKHDTDYYCARVISNNTQPQPCNPEKSSPPSNEVTLSFAPSPPPPLVSSEIAISHHARCLVEPCGCSSSAGGRKRRGPMTHTIFYISMVLSCYCCLPSHCYETPWQCNGMYHRTRHGTVMTRHKGVLRFYTSWHCHVTPQGCPSIDLGSGLGTGFGVTLHGNGANINFISPFHGIDMAWPLY